jgi:hypothetical protein
MPLRAKNSRFGPLWAKALYCRPLLLIFAFQKNLTRQRAFMMLAPLIWKRYNGKK